MPKFKKHCHNFFHEEWSSGEEDEWKVENLKPGFHMIVAVGDASATCP